jgi:adenylate cyclase
MKLFLFLLFLSFFCPVFSAPVLKAVKGEIDLRNWDFSQDIISLEGEWEFYWKQFIKTDSISVAKPNGFSVIPGLWNDEKVDGETLGGFGYATYRLVFYTDPKNKYLSLKVLDLSSAFRVWVNGEIVLENGKIGKTEKEMVPQYYPKITILTNLQERNEICVEISNFQHRKGGFWEGFRLGNFDKIQSYRENKFGFDLFLTGSLLIMGVYHIGLFSLRRKDKSSLILGFFCFVLVLRISVTGERILFQAYPNFPWGLGLKIEYLTFYLASPLFASFIYYLYPKEFKLNILKLFIIICSIFALIIIFTKPHIYSRTLVPYELSVVLFSLYTIYVMSIGIIRKKEGATVAFMGFLLFFATIVNDMLYSSLIINSYYLAPFGLFLFIFSQAFILSLRFSKAFAAVESLSEDLIHTNNSYSRFVPREFLSFLDKSNIVDVKLGDQVRKKMTVLFSDIRSFTEISESMSPEENFNFLNSYLKIMGPIIRKNHGFIDKYIGDAIMALFPESPKSALLTALDMQKKLEAYNVVHEDHIKIGIGLHVGFLMLGTVGEEERMEGTVISDAVNLASRLEGLTKEYHVGIIISKQVLLEIPDLKETQYRFLGSIKVKGKKEVSDVYEVFSSDSEKCLEKKIYFREDFEKAIHLYLNEDYLSALQVFQSIFEFNSEDKACQKYIQLCQSAMGVIEKQ